jgi:SAM-dependent methyltransferase
MGKSSIPSIPYEFNPNVSFPAYLTRRGILKSIVKYAPKLKGIMMDFGCGAKPYKNVFDVAQYIGVDFQGDGHSHENEVIDVFYDGHHIPFDNASFDSVFSSEVFEHIFNLPDILKEINRVTRMGGKLLITCPFSICEHEVPNDFARYSSYAIKHLVEQNGFKLIAQEKTGNSIEAIFQLYITYIHQNIAPKLRKIPVVRTVFKKVTYTSLNLFAKLLSKMLPKGRELYLNNVLLCEKIEEVCV